MKSTLPITLTLFGLVLVAAVFGTVTGKAVSGTFSLGEEVTAGLGKTYNIGGYEVMVLNRALDAPDVATFSICKANDCKTASTMRAGKSVELSVGGKNLKLEVKVVDQRKSATFTLTDMSVKTKQETITEEIKEPEQPRVVLNETAPVEKTKQPTFFEGLINWLRGLLGKK